MGFLIRSTLAVVLCGLAIATPDRADARSEFEICNKGDEDIRYAIARRARLPGGSFGWKLEGWFRVDQNTCRLVSTAAASQRVYLSVQTWRDSQWRVASYEPEAIPSSLIESESFGVERFYCAKGETFESNAGAFQDHAPPCSRDLYPQLFNLFVYIRDRSDFTLSLS